MKSGLFETVNNVVSLIALGYLALVINGILKAPTREARERYEVFKASDHVKWVRIGVPVLFLVVLLLFLFDRDITG